MQTVVFAGRNAAAAGRVLGLLRPGLALPRLLAEMQTIQGVGDHPD